MLRDHFADVAVDEMLIHPKRTWTELARSLPSEVTEATFAAYVATEAGKVWVATMRDRAKHGPDQSATETCTRRATKKLVDCAGP